MLDKMIIKKEQYPETWPFTFDSCEIFSVAFQAYVTSPNGRCYQLNGVPAVLRIRPLEKVWLKNPKIPGTRISIAPFIQLALDNPRELVDAFLLETG